MIIICFKEFWHWHSYNLDCLHIYFIFILRKIIEIIIIREINIRKVNPQWWTMNIEHINPFGAVRSIKPGSIWCSNIGKVSSRCYSYTSKQIKTEIKMCTSIIVVVSSQKYIIFLLTPPGSSRMMQRASLPLTWHCCWFLQRHHFAKAKFHCLQNWNLPQQWHKHNLCWQFCWGG